LDFNYTPARSRRDVIKRGEGPNKLIRRKKRDYDLSIIWNTKGGRHSGGGE